MHGHHLVGHHGCRPHLIEITPLAGCQERVGCQDPVDHVGTVVELVIEREPEQEGRLAGVPEVIVHRGHVGVQIGVENFPRLPPLGTAFDALLDQLDRHGTIQRGNPETASATALLELAAAATRAWIVARNSSASHIESNPEGSQVGGMAITRSPLHQVCETGPVLKVVAGINATPMLAK